MYEVMVAWSAVHADDDLPSYVRDFAAIWQAAEKIVFSRTLESPSSTRTRIERDFTPERIREIKTKAARDLTVGGPTLASEAIKNGLVDEWHLFIAPVVVGGGTPFLPDRVRVRLELLDHHRFGNGMVHLRYRTCATGTPQSRETAALPLV